MAGKPSASAAALGGARDSPFARRDTPPGGIDGFLEFTAGGGDFCNDFDERRRPRVALLVGLSGLPIGACGFDLPSSEPADLTVEGPGGWRWSG
ncbi:MAG TPA: hypothetical protein VHK06_08050, partial [Candidatus Limnocylindria bacterium]|nr:hypothetical protein [Candidatus Limnocylindria bacterium]